ncbi:16S rRNA (guanine(527)-N(7))-methyltransferase RsmG [Methyloceanibacter sp.]|uniref:16S rRNA (guanine(527)-N(7))-methyltransferase RsmG n=1 Tax=Methyloceanibacter sp. TaxID=1965321 RepID=UPI002D33E869|nr:16S rRNA (guanine(527)-N(7))-methyltransferase RsmG [Methyloceanibacter sp.]HZP09756.1 16S rRNA (guanine(527)-N(7))-methyltransferase RsmG [Methyloceanibacter sp.]
MAKVNASFTVRGPQEFAEAFKVPRETIHRLTRYAELLALWQKRINLVAPSTLDELWSRHFADSAQLLSLAPDARLWLDLGSGAGFPGLVIGIVQAGTPHFRMHLVESNHKKCAFLAEVARATEAPVDIHPMRIEDLAESAQSLTPDVVSARALAPLPRLFELAAPFFGERTRGLFPKGREAEAEVDAAREGWTFSSRLHPSLTSRDSKIVEVTALCPRARTKGDKP